MKVEPASLTKLMTAYLVFNALKDKKLALDTRPPVSPQAHAAIGSRMFIDPPKPATVDELIHGLIIQSGNDAAIVLAEAIGGSEAGFTQQMNAEAKRMGLTNTLFSNASGLPGAQHYSTARDLATLATRLIQDHPDFYKLYSQRDYTYNNIKQPNRNRLLSIDPTVDGVKTGHTDAAGFCLVASSRRVQPGTDIERRLLSVVLGAASESARAIESQKLLNYGFGGFDLVKLYGKDQAAASYPVFKGAAREVKAGFEGAVLVTVPRGQGQKVKGEIERIQPLVGPLTKGQRIGTLRVQYEDKTIAEHPLLTLEAVDQAGVFGRAWDTGSAERLFGIGVIFHDRKEKLPALELRFSTSCFELLRISFFHIFKGGVWRHMKTLGTELIIHAIMNSPEPFCDSVWFLGFYDRVERVLFHVFT
jgi:D-alanyl-D-alanine carboxypeptidase (penicillin-binding protein 5/6)